MTHEALMEISRTTAAVLFVCLDIGVIALLSAFVAGVMKWVWETITE